MSTCCHFAGVVFKAVCILLAKVKMVLLSSIAALAAGLLPLCVPTLSTFDSYTHRTGALTAIAPMQPV